MDNKINSLKLNKKDHKIYLILNFLLFVILFFLAIFIIYKIIFPSQYFTYSFANVNSLKNTITDVNLSDQAINFYASTALNFSQVKINLELSQSNNQLENKKISTQKSYKSFFYPQGDNLINLGNKEENRLISIDNSVFIVGNNQMTPIDSTLTFESLGYNWDNVAENKSDLSTYEKLKLADTNAAHPTGTILKTTEDDDFYFIENRTKRKILNPQIENIKNAILINSSSLDTKENCALEKSVLLAKEYQCTLNLSSLRVLHGKDYRFELNDLPANLIIKQIDLEFKRYPSKENFQFFLSDLKKKILYRFGIEKFE